jgi:hypothetical protein
VSYWTPQGITGNGSGVQAVSWYRGSSGSEEGVRVSFVNRSEGTHGEYQVYEDDDPVTRIARWRIGAKSNLLTRPAASGAWRTGFDQLQGVITNKGRIFVSSTEGPRGFLYHGRPKRKAQRDRWGAGPEALYATSTQLWSLTEAKGARTVFGKTFRSLIAE